MAYEKECDEVLKFLLDNPKNETDKVQWWYFTLRPQFKHLKDADFETVIFTLYSDKNIESINNLVPTSANARVIYFSISAKGKLFIRSGGYIGKLNQQTTENLRMEKLESFQKDNARQMTVLTKVLAYATIALVLVEVIKLFIEHNPFSCH